jgi:hypothetical protein
LSRECGQKLYANFDIYQVLNEKIAVCLLYFVVGVL